MSITYTYEIVAVDEAARVMEVVYTAEGHPTQHIGARLPYEGESLDAVIEMYSPVRFWEELQLAVVAPAVGITGTIIPEEPTPQPGSGVTIFPTPASGSIGVTSFE